MAQQKQRKQLILTDNRNISAYRFQLIQHLQSSFMTNGIRNFMYTKHNVDNAKLRIFSFIAQRQRIQPNFMNYSIRTFIHTKQLNTHTQPEQPNSAVFIFNGPISNISSITNFVHFIDPQKSVLSLLNNFVHFIHPYMNLLPTEIGTICLRTLLRRSFKIPGVFKQKYPQLRVI